MSRTSDQQHRWRSAHRGKRVYHTRERAWRAVISTCARNRRLDLRLRPYRCRWKNNYLAPDGASGPPHWHIGHAASSRKARNRRTWLRVHVIWPYYRARRWARSRKRKAAEDVSTILQVGLERCIRHG